MIHLVKRAPIARDVIWLVDCAQDSLHGPVHTQHPVAVERIKAIGAGVDLHVSDVQVVDACDCGHCVSPK